MRKVAVARCAFIVLTLSTFAASGADKTVKNSEYGYEITFPETWKVRQSEGVQVIADSPLAHSYVTVDVNARDIAEGTLLKDFVEKNKLDIPVAEEVDLKLGGKDARKVTYKYTPENVVLVHYFLVSGKRGYLIVLDWLKIDSDVHAKDIDAIVKSFKLIEAK
ncbi:MAG TPA: PsbP-related protein [Planctomycetota bacterium]|nr:PsbP-related protein [Planctomycetota bacterium]